MFVSVIIPTYNRKDYVRESIDSALAQRGIAVEVIVVDDGSQDGTGEALLDYGDQIRYVWQENQGESSARNHGVRIARHEYVALLDSDDLWQPDSLAKRVSLLENDPALGAVFSKAWLVDEEGKRLDAPPLSDHVKSDDLTLESLCLKNNLVASTAVFRRSIFDKVGGFDSEIQFGEDWDLWLRFALESKLGFVDEPLVYVRRHTGAQQHFPNARRAEQEIGDRVKMLEKIFSLAQERFDDDYQNRCLAHHYGLAAFQQYAVGRGEKGRELLAYAAELDSNEWRSEERLREEMVSVALRKIAAEGGRSAEPGVQCVKEAVAYWPSEIPTSRDWGRKTIAKVYALSLIHISEPTRPY